ncbi:hypothetical protein [Rugosimonospora africana]|uniref:Uncharacterized protein n=1 Tax=Rugosimonospora africana TaxID=556532 RepID=A0A8J3VW74_9ACTN|nr:hypothetical protein [Rugosimonospora africana]GIH20531.1 hypothetical protein Raf01_87030 [Rugosimonospora africana]
MDATLMNAQAAPASPNNAMTRAVRDQIYFGGQHSPTALLVLSAWIVGGLLVIGIADWVHLLHRRYAVHSLADICAPESDCLCDRPM